MTLVAFIRHGPTEWNETGIVQGRSDIPLSESGRREVAGWRVPAALSGFDWVSSPLSRAAETAKILTGTTVPTDPRLVEMDWSVWEGRTLPDLRAELGDLLAAWEAEGLDFRAPGGESPREVQTRLKAFLGERSEKGRDTVSVCHKGVIRAVYALAVDWDMTDRPPQKLKDGCAQMFRIDAEGHPSVHALDIPLEDEAA
jgi:broad specificity phosphatase PhoE